jgi:hypothetical protein
MDATFRKRRNITIIGFVLPLTVVISDVSAFHLSHGHVGMQLLKSHGAYNRETWCPSLSAAISPQPESSPVTLLEEEQDAWIANAAEVLPNELSFPSRYHEDVMTISAESEGLSSSSSNLAVYGSKDELLNDQIEGEIRDMATTIAADETLLSELDVLDHSFVSSGFFESYQNRELLEQDLRDVEGNLHNSQENADMQNMHPDDASIISSTTLSGSGFEKLPKNNGEPSVIEAYNALPRAGEISLIEGSDIKDGLSNPPIVESVRAQASESHPTVNSILSVENSPSETSSTISFVEESDTEEQARIIPSNSGFGIDHRVEEASTSSSPEEKIQEVILDNIATQELEPLVLANNNFSGEIEQANNFSVVSAIEVSSSNLEETIEKIKRTDQVQRENRKRSLQFIKEPTSPLPPFYFPEADKISSFLKSAFTPSPSIGTLKEKDDSTLIECAAASATKSAIHTGKMAAFASETVLDVVTDQHVLYAAQNTAKTVLECITEEKNVFKSIQAAVSGTVTIADAIFRTASVAEKTKSTLGAAEEVGQGLSTAFVALSLFGGRQLRKIVDYTLELTEQQLAAHREKAAYEATIAEAERQAERERQRKVKEYQTALNHVEEELSRKANEEKRQLEEEYQAALRKVEEDLMAAKAKPIHAVKTREKDSSLNMFFAKECQNET